MFQQVIYKIQECEALLATAHDKGEQIAAEGSVSDRNTITEQLTSLKQQLSSLRRAVEKRRGEHENAAAQYKRLATELDSLLDKLHELEGTIRCRPVLHLLAESVEIERAAHKSLASEATALMKSAETLFSAVPQESVIPSTLQERMSEAAFLRDTLPAELAARASYLDEQFALRSQYDVLVRRLNIWLDEAKLQLRPSSTGVDFDRVDKELEEHVVSLCFCLFFLTICCTSCSFINFFRFIFCTQAYFSSSASPFDLLENIRTTADQIWQSVDMSQQEVLMAEVNSLSEWLKNCLGAATDRQEQLEKDVKASKHYAKLLQEADDFIKDKSNISDEVATNIPALKALVANLETKLQSLQVLHI